VTRHDRLRKDQRDNKSNKNITKNTGEKTTVVWTCHEERRELYRVLNMKVEAKRKRVTTEEME
jgi:H2-forming N5,N10-methylenetetrahydromethanopterin dehydrogenase-like enzyme